MLDEAEAEDVTLPAPCSIHDDRLRALETEQASHGAQLQAGSQMFEAIQESIRMLSNHVGDSMGRVERTVDRLAGEVSTLSSQVGELRVKQTQHDSILTDLTAQRAKADAEAENRKKTLREYVTKIVLGVLKVGGIIVVVRYGPEWLVSAVKTLAGG